MARSKLLCHGCGKRFAHRTGADLFCSPGCGKAHEQKKQEAIAQLTEAGFTQNERFPFSFSKDGCSVTVNQAIRHGIAYILAAHEAAVSYHARKHVVDAAPTS